MEERSGCGWREKRKGEPEGVELKTVVVGQGDTGLWEAHPDPPVLGSLRLGFHSRTRTYASSELVLSP